MKKGMKNRIFKKITVMILILILAIPSSQFSKRINAETSNKESDIPAGYTPIYTISDLYAIRNNLEGKYILMNDLDLTAATGEGGSLNSTGHGWDPINNFQGILDGNGHTIQGMQIYGDITNAYIGLFGSITGKRTYNEGLDQYEYSGGVVKNLGMVNVNINVSSTDLLCGAISGKMGWDTLISNCFVTGDIKITNTNTISHFTKIGGLLGAVEHSSEIRDSYNAADISLIGNNADLAQTAGIVGDITDTNMYNCYNNGSIFENELQGDAICAYQEYGTFNNCFQLKDSGKDTYGYGTPLTEFQMKNKDFFTNFDFENIWFLDPYSNHPYPQLKSCPQQHLDSIEVINPPTKREYFQGDKLDCTGGTVRLKYKDGLEQEVLLTEDMLGKYDMNNIGFQKIPITYYGLVDTQFEINISEIPVDGIQLNRNELTIYKGKSESLSVTFLPENATNKEITWDVISGDSVTVDDNGIVTANKSGISTVRATSSNGKYADCVIHVETACILLQLNHYDVTINKGDSSSVADTIGYSMSPLDCTDTVSWKSSNENILMIDNNGIMTGISAGTVTVTGTTTSGSTALANITVQRNINEFTVTGLSNKYYTGKAIQQKISVSDGSTTLEENINYNISYQENVKTGTAKIIITGISPYVGTVEQSFQILQPKNLPEDNQDMVNTPSEVKISKIIADKRNLTVTWKKVKGARGYRIQIATNKKFNKGVKTYSASSSTKKKIFKGLKKGKTYYVRIAAYCNNEEGTILMGKYSITKKKKTRK